MFKIEILLRFTDIISKSWHPVEIRMELKAVT